MHSKIGAHGLDTVTRKFQKIFSGATKELHGTIDSTHKSKQVKCVRVHSPWISDVLHRFSLLRR